MKYADRIPAPADKNTGVATIISQLTAKLDNADLLQAKQIAFQIEEMIGAYNKERLQRESFTSIKTIEADPQGGLLITFKPEVLARQSDKDNFLHIIAKNLEQYIVEETLSVFHQSTLSAPYKYSGAAKGTLQIKDDSIRIMPKINEVVYHSPKRTFDTPPPPDISEISIPSSFWENVAESMQQKRKEENKTMEPITLT